MTATRPEPVDKFDYRCPWWAVCRCTHTGGCVRGWLPDAPGHTTDGTASEGVARRCPVCDAARQNRTYDPFAGPGR